MANFDPSEETRFTSENQPKNKGPKKGSRHISTIFKSLLDCKANRVIKSEEQLELISQAFKKDKKNITIEDVMSFNAFNRAIKGDYKFHKDVLDRVYGQAKQQMELSGDKENPLNLNLNKPIEELLKDL